MNIYIEIEVYQREFDARLSLALKAASDFNFKVFLMHRSEIIYLGLRNLIKPGIIHLKDVNSLDNDLYNSFVKLKSKGFVFTSQDEESGITFDNFNIFSIRRFENYRTMKLLSRYFSFGKRDYLFLKKKISKVINSGSPRFSLLNKKYFIETKKDFTKRLNLKKKYLLISSNISFPVAEGGLANFYKRFIRFAKGQVFDIKKKLFFQKSIQNLKILEEFLELIEFLSKKYNHLDIVIKPHPKESINTWNDLLINRRKNIKIINSETLASLINYSDVLVHNGCTGAIEAFFLKKPIICYEPTIFDDKFDKTLTNSLGVKTKNLKSFKKELDYIIKYKSNSRITKNKILKDRVANIYNQKKSVEIIVDEWKKIRNKKKNINSGLSIFTFLYFYILRKTFSKIKYSIIGKRLPFQLKFPDLEVGKIDNLLKRNMALFKLNKDIRFMKLSSNTLYVYKN